MTGYYTTAERSNNPMIGVISEYKSDDEKRTSKPSPDSDSRPVSNTKAT